MVWNFQFNLPTSIEFGNGTVKHVGKRAKELGGTMALILTDKGLAKTGVLEKVTCAFDQEGIHYLVYDVKKPISNIKTRTSIYWLVSVEEVQWIRQKQSVHC